MAREPYVALFKTASGSLTRRKILADVPQSIAKQRVLSKWPSEVTTCVSFFSRHIARIAKYVSN